MAICALLQHHLLVPVQHYQDDHHCVEPSYSVAQAWTLIKRFYGLLVPKLATPGGDKYPLPSQVYRLLGTKVDLIASPRKGTICVQYCGWTVSKKFLHCACE